MTVVVNKILNILDFTFLRIKCWICYHKDILAIPLPSKKQTFFWHHSRSEEYEDVHNNCS